MSSAVHWGVSAATRHRVTVTPVVHLSCVRAPPLQHVALQGFAASPLASYPRAQATPRASSVLPNFRGQSPSAAVDHRFLAATCAVSRLRAGNPSPYAPLRQVMAPSPLPCVGTSCETHR